MDDLAPSLAQVEQLLARAKVEADEARRRYERIRRAALLARYQAGESLLELADREGMDRRDARSLVRETAAAVGVDLRTSSGAAAACDAGRRSSAASCACRSSC
jgi:hypothetical protein